MNLNPQKLNELMHSFHTLTGIKLAVFDRNGYEVAAYPDGHCPFCAGMHANPSTRALCDASDRSSFERCRETRRLIVYECHAGLIEASAPLEQDGIVFGYIMIGQISDNRDVAKKYSVLYKSQEDIRATVEILRACISYLLLNEMVAPERQRFFARLNECIDAHLTDHLSSASLAKALSMSRSKLYELSGRYLGQGVADYVTYRRMAHAQQLLKDTSLPIAQVAMQSGYPDYNYFCRLFRKRCNQTPKQYRSQHQ